MGTEIVIVLGLGILSALFSYYAFEFLQRPEQPESQQEEGRRSRWNWAGLMGVLCFILAVVFINMLMYTLVLVAQNTGLTYLNDTVLVVGMEVVMWATLSGIALYTFVLLLGSLYFIYDSVMVWWKGRKKGASW